MQIFRLALVVTSTTVLLGWAAAVWFSSEPEIIDIKEHVTKSAPAGKPVIGYATTDTLIFVTETLLDKLGGFIANDLMPPFSLMDNMPAWELGALEMVRDLSLAMRRDFSRSQSQSMENELLKQVQPKFIFHR